MEGPIERSRPTTPNPPSNMPKPGLLKLGGQAPQNVDRKALLK